MRRLLVVALMLTALLASSCVARKIEGSGNIVTDVREVGGYERISLSNMGVAVLTQGDSEGLTIRADDNLMQYIVTEVKDGALRIGLTPMAAMGMLHPSEQIVFEVSFKELKGLSVSGSGTFEVGRLETEFLDVSVSGSGKIEVAELTAQSLRTSISGSGRVIVGGEARTQSVSVSGSGRYSTTDLVTRDAEVAVSGSGGVVLHATSSLDVRISGSGSVRYYGQPEIKESITGSGSLRGVDSR